MRRSFQDIRFIWSHAGGSAPFLAGRINAASGNARDALPEGFIAAARRFFYDTAGAANRGALVSLRELVSASQIVFGTDFPPGGTSAAVAKTLAETHLFNDAELQAIGRDTAVRLVPRLGPVIVHGIPGCEDQSNERSATTSRYGFLAVARKLSTSRSLAKARLARRPPRTEHKSGERHHVYRSLSRPQRGPARPISAPAAVSAS